MVEETKSDQPDFSQYCQKLDYYSNPESIRRGSMDSKTLTVDERIGVSCAVSLMTLLRNTKLNNDIIASKKNSQTLPVGSDG